MVSSDDSGDRLASVQMNAELRHAQLEMLSAQCATDRLRLRYSVDHLARHAQRDLLRKAWSSANALFEYYNSIVNQMPDRHLLEKSTMSLQEAKVLDISDRLVRHLREQREYFRPIGRPLQPGQRDAMAPFFSPALLAQVRVVVLDSQWIPKPSLEMRATGLLSLPDVTHSSLAAFEDVVVFHDEVAPRVLFHALVHAVQIEALGLEVYAEHFVRGFLRSDSHASVPFEVHAAMLEAAFAGQALPFSVEEKVRLWINQGRY